MYRENKECFYASEFILNEKMQEVKAYDNPEEKECALSDEANLYYKIAKHSMEQLFNRELVKKNTILDPTDNKENFLTRLANIRHQI